ncbi:MAG: sulfurtransferase TusA family protein [Anaerolineae bacterium]
MECKVDVRGQTCPVPLVELRRAVRSAQPGDVIEISGDHPASKGEIQLAAKSLKLTVLSVEENGSIWTIRIQR